MTPKQIRLVKETFPTVQSMGAAMARLFYGRLFQRDPSTRAMFHTDIQAQGTKFTQMLTALVDGIDDLPQFETMLRQMGQRHVGYGVKPEHYPMVRDALLWAIGHTLGHEWNDNVKAAWSALIDHVAKIMLEGERQIAAATKK